MQTVAAPKTSAVPKAAKYGPIVKAILESDLERSVGSTEDSITLPPACYTDPDFFEFEKDAIFYKEWLCVGRVDQVPNVGDYFTVTVVDEPLIIVRASEQEIRVMSAVCRHRGMVITARSQADIDEAREPIPEASGNCSQFKCPYHSWTYDLEGRLTLAPDMDRTPCFNRTEVQLPSFRVELWKGFIFTNFDPEASPLTPRLARVSELFKNWPMEQMVDAEPNYLYDMPWNWKLMHENSIEDYHGDHLHAGLHALLPGGNVLPTLYEEGDAALISRIRATMKGYPLNPTYKPLLPRIETLVDEDRWIGMFALIPPTILIHPRDDSVLYRIVLPTSAGSINIRFGNLVPRKHLHHKRFKEARNMLTEGVRIFGRQDFATDAAVHKGLRSRFAARSPYSWQEDPLPHFNRWLVERYTAAARELPDLAARGNGSG